MDLENLYSVLKMITQESGEVEKTPLQYQQRNIDYYRILAVSN